MLQETALNLPSLEMKCCIEVLERCYDAISNITAWNYVCPITRVSNKQQMTHKACFISKKACLPQELVREVAQET